MRIVLAGLLLLALPRVGLGQGLEGTTRRLEQLLAQSFGRTVPLLAASAGVTYRFDPVTASFEREAALGGQLFLERADPLGKGRWNAALSYQYVALDTIEGQPAGALGDPLPLALAGSDGTVVGAATIDRLSIEAVTHQVTASLTYGVTDALDVNITLPLVHSRGGAAVAMTRLLVEPEPSFARIGAATAFEDTNVGDLVVRGKLRLVERDPVHVAAGLVARFPTGDAERLQGTGAYEVAPLLYLSTRRFVLAPWAQFVAHVNAGADLVADDMDLSEGRWGVGFDWGITEGVSAAVAVLGRHPVQPLAPPGFFDFVRLLPGPRLATAPLFGLSGERPDYYDLSLGGRANVWRDTVIVFANAVFPLNDAGIRNEIIPLAGVEVAW